MSKRKYTRIQVLEEEILSMRGEGAIRQEIADRFGLSKVQIKNWINRYNRKQAKLAAGIPPRPIGRPSKPMRFSGFVWRINCCGIFCASQKGSEAENKIPHHTSSQNRVSRDSHVQILWSIQKRLLRLRPSSG